MPQGLATQLARRSRQVYQILTREGQPGIARRLERSLLRRLGSGTSELPVSSSDVVGADLSNPYRPAVMSNAGTGMVMNWVMTPPARGSGGHTTIFRIIRRLDSLGHKQRIYFYDIYGADHRYYADIVREHYGFAGVVEPTGTTMADADAVFATSWPTAYAVYNARCTGKRYYFVQDFEPDFYPAGSARVLAENTYRMGFHGLTAGPWLAKAVGDRFGMPADHFTFGCDTSNYRLESSGVVRNGIAFYARQGTPRRGVELGIYALEVFARRNPAVPIHLFGQERLPRMAFPFIDHGVASASELNRIYNCCVAGMSLSLTNASLVPHEMLAAGCIPVVNDAEHNRMVLDNPLVRYVGTAPQAIASALEELVRSPEISKRATVAAASVRSMSWDDAGDLVESVLKRHLEEDRP